MSEEPADLRLDQRGHREHAEAAGAAGVHVDMPRLAGKGVPDADGDIAVPVAVVVRAGDGDPEAVIVGGWSCEGQCWSAAEPARGAMIDIDLARALEEGIVGPHRDIAVAIAVDVTRAHGRAPEASRRV